MVFVNDARPLVACLFKSSPLPLLNVDDNCHWIQVHDGPEYMSSLLSNLGDLSQTCPNVSTLVLIVEVNVLSDDEQKELQERASQTWPRARHWIVGTVTDMALQLIESTTKLVLYSEGTKVSTVATNGLNRRQLCNVLISSGSPYSVSTNALQEAYTEYQKSGHSNLLQDIAFHLELSSVTKVRQWADCATSSEITSLCQLIVNSNEAIAQQVIHKAVEAATSDLIWSLKSLIHSSELPPTEVVGKLFLIGDLFKAGNNKLSQLIACRLSQNFPNCAITVHSFTLGDIVRETVARCDLVHRFNGFNDFNPIEMTYHSSKVRKVCIPAATGLPPTESRNHLSTHLDTMPIKNAIELMVNEEIYGLSELLNHHEQIERLIEVISVALRAGNRLFYVGAGTSGRLGVLDAAECVSTFSSPSHLVQGLLAGGSRGMFEAVASSEDSFEDGCLVGKKFGAGDVIIGISASGLTPFVWGALFAARSIKSFTALVTFNPNVQFKLKPDMVLTLHVGAEVLTGSTRLKCGTATKCLLDVLSTLSMVRMGKCIENLMVEVEADNDKLKERATRIVAALCSEPPITMAKCRRTLELNQFNIRTTVHQLKLIDE